MSYSFTIKSGSSKEDAKQQVAAEMAKVVAVQPDHVLDQRAAINATGVLIDLLEEFSLGMEISVHVNGSLSWQDDPDQTPTRSYRSVSLSIHTDIRRVAADPNQKHST